MQRLVDIINNIKADPEKLNAEYLIPRDQTRVYMININTKAYPEKLYNMSNL